MDTILKSFNTLHMPGMASCWKTLTETHQLNKLSLSDGLELLLQSELDNRRNNKSGDLSKVPALSSRPHLKSWKPAMRVAYLLEQSPNWHQANI